MVINNDMSRESIPGNRRSCELAIQIKQLTGEFVLHISRDTPFADYFKERFEEAGVEYQSYDENPHLQIEGLLKDVYRFGRWRAVFMHLWFWGPDTIPESYLRSIRFYSPETRIVVVSDDYHGYRERMVTDHLQSLAKITPDELAFPFFRQSTAVRSENFVMATIERERLAYKRADHVLMVSERDTRSLKEKDTTIDTPISTLHWTHPLFTRTKGVRIDQLPLYEDRSGIVFVGFFQNPTNTLAIQWFCSQVLPLISTRLAQDDVPLRFIGNFQEVVPIAAKMGIRVITNEVSLSDDEMLKVLQSSRILIAPITASTGVNTKTLLAWSSGVPIVCSQLAAEGFGWSDDPQQLAILAKAFLPADTPEDFARGLLEVYYQKEVWEQLLEGGLEFSGYILNSERFGKDLTEVLTQIEQTRPRRMEQSGYPASQFDIFRDMRHLFEYEWSRNDHDRDIAVSWTVVWVNVVVVCILFLALGRPSTPKDRVH